MAQNHRGQEIGADNHANLVTRVRHASEHVAVSLLGQEGGSSPEYSVFSDKTTHRPDTKYQATTYSMPMADADGNPTNNLSIGYYSNPRRAEMAGIARANRHARTGDWGDQGEIKKRKRIRINKENQRIEHEQQRIKAGEGARMRYAEMDAREAAIDHLARYGGAQ